LTNVYTKYIIKLEIKIFLWGKGVVIMKKTRKFNIHNLSKYVPVAVILLAVSIIIGSTFAYFTDSKQDEGALIFSKIELSNESTTGINGTLQDVIPGTPLIDSPITFSKSIDSEPMYVRVKMSYSLPSELQNDEDMLEYVTLLREAKSYDVVATEQNGAVWSTKNGNYFYLLDSADNTRLKVVDDIYTYKFTDSIIIPRDLEQLPEHAQYMQVINFHLAIEAIQANNVSDLLNDTKAVFESVFPQNENEVYKEPVNVAFHDENGEVMNSIEINEEGKITEIEYVPAEEGAVFVGWFTDAAFSNPFDFNTVVTENVSLYPKVITVNYDNFEFSGNTLTKYVGTDTEVIVPSSYSISGKYDATVYFDDPNELYDYINEMTTTKITVTDSEGQSYTFRRWEYSEEMYNCAYPVSFTTQKDKYIKGDTYQVTIIGDKAFYQNKDIAKVILPDTITKINSQAFCDCSNLVDINYPEALTTIGSQAFLRVSITEFYVGENLISIDDNPFCTDTIEKITIHSNNSKYYVDGNCLIERDTKTLILGCNNSVIPNGIEIIGEDAFRETKIKEVIIPYGVKEIRDTVFVLCKELERVEIPNSVTTIGSNVFLLCEKIKRLEIPNSVTSIGRSAFNNSGLETIKMPENITEFAVELFVNCSSLNNIIIGSNVTSIGIYAFMYCNNLTNIYINSSTIARNPNSGSSSNYLLSYVENVYIKTSITSVSSTFKKVDNTIYTYEGVNYYLYTV